MRRLRMDNGEVLGVKTCDRCGQALDKTYIATPNAVYCSAECYEDA